MALQSELITWLETADVDDELCWTEAELPERERTKHVHRLHPYLGKFVPQLVSIFLDRYFAPGEVVLDPFSGSGTTLVECTTNGMHAIGIDVSAFNVLLAQVKTARLDVGIVTRELERALRLLHEATIDVELPDSEYLRSWFHQNALEELLRYRTLIDDHPNAADVMRIVLSRAARSARRTAHFDLDFPRSPQIVPYHCRKHNRECRPVEEAAKFLRRYTADTIRRLDEYARVRHDVDITVMHDDARHASYRDAIDGIITSPPYPGRIDYHEQHRYAYELLGLEDRRSLEIGAAAGGATIAAVRRYVDDMVSVFDRARGAMRPGAPVVIVVDDARSLYAEILERSGLELVRRSRRHVNRRTGRRAGEFFEDVLIARA